MYKRQVLSLILTRCVRNAAPIVGSLFSEKSLETNLNTMEDFPTAASPKRTNFIDVTAEFIL